MTYALSHVSAVAASLNNGTRQGYTLYKIARTANVIQTFAPAFVVWARDM